MPTEFLRKANPFKSPTKPMPSSEPSAASDTHAQQSDILATADLLLGQLKGLENLCSTVEERVQRKRQALKELEYLISGSNSANGSPRSPACPANTPVSARLHLVSPRLRGLFDLHGPGQANLDAIQSCLDYSPEIQTEDDLSTREDPGHSELWEDDDKEALISPFDDKFALLKSAKKAGKEKDLPEIPLVGASEVLQSKIPRKIHIRRQLSVSRRFAGRSSSAATRSTSNRRRSGIHNVKVTNGTSYFTTKGTMRRGSWKRSIMENVKTKSGAKTLSAIENETTKEGERRKEKRKGLRSIYSVCSELGMSGTHHAV